MIMDKLHIACHAVLLFVLCHPVIATAASTAHDPATASSRTAAKIPASPVPVTGLSDPAGTGAGIDVILLMDSSGSMKRTDPRNYRKSAAKLFIALLGNNDRIGIMSFGDAARQMIPLTKNTSANRKKLFDAVEEITSKEFSTNIADAVQKSYDVLKGTAPRERMVVMMSDGRLALGSKDKDAAASTALEQLLPALAHEGIRLNTVAFTRESDSALLADMAKKTNGLFRFARTDKDVHLMFASIFEKIKAPDRVPFAGGSFTLDSSIREATVLVTKHPGTSLVLVDPAGKKSSSAKHSTKIAWFESPLFDMITIQEPASGAWRVKMSMDQGSTVYVLTNLNLKTSFNKDFVSKGDNVVLDAWLEKQGGIVTEKDLLGSTTFAAVVTDPDSRIVKLDLVSTASASTASSTNGTHSIVLPIVAVGEYSVKLIARGRTFTRERMLLFKAAEAPPVQKIERAHQPEPLPTPLPAAAPPAPVPHEEAFSWTEVLVRFGIVNLAAVLIVLAAGAAYILGKKLALKRKKP